MAANVNDEQGIKDYHETVTLQFPDMSFQVTLDQPTLRRIEAGDNDLLETIKANHLASVGHNEVGPSVIPCHTQVTPSGSQCVAKLVPSASPSQSGVIPSVCLTQESEEHTGTYTFWPREAILLLISLYTENEKDIENPKTKKKDSWKQITEGMNKKGYHFDQNKIESKWRYLVMTYKEVKCNNTLSGRKRKTCKYFEELDVVLSKRHDMQPIFTAGSHVDLNNNPVYGSTATVVTKVSDKNESSVPKNKKKKVNDEQGQLLTFLIEREEQRKVEREEREKKKEKRADDKLELMKELVHALKK